MPPDRAAGRYAAKFSAPAGRRFDRPPRRYRDCGSNAAAHRPPGAAPKSARYRSRRYRSCRHAPGHEGADRADLIGAAGIGLAEIARDVERFIEILAIDEIEAEQLFL